MFVATSHHISIVAPVFSRLQWLHLPFFHPPEPGLRGHEDHSGVPHVPRK